MSREKAPSSKKVLEKDIQRAILDWLATKDHILFWRQNTGAIFGRNNGGNMAFRRLPKYAPVGIPDIWIVAFGKVIGLEVKRPSGAIREVQKDFGGKLIEHGGHYYIVRSLQEAKDALNQFGIYDHGKN